jgi:hypothetical protein
MRLANGITLGQYEILAPIGSGGMGELEAFWRRPSRQLKSRLPRAKSKGAQRGIVNAYIQRKVMPNDPVGDALHLALASYHKCDFLLTWNCNHSANANKFGHIRRVNAMLGLYVPLLVTPLEMLGGPENEG